MDAEAAEAAEAGLAAAVGAGSLAMLSNAAVLLASASEEVLYRWVRLPAVYAVL
jgi:hypothetical protein